MLKDKEVVSDPQRQYEIARGVHAQSHGGINKTTATIADKYHWVRIKETVSLVIKNCPDCKEGTAKAPPVRPNGESNGGIATQGRRAAASGNGANVDPNSMIERLVNFDEVEPSSNAMKPKSKSTSPLAQSSVSPGANMRALQKYNDFPLDPQIISQQQTSGQYAHRPFANTPHEADGTYQTHLNLNGNPQGQDLKAEDDTRMATERHVREGDEPMAYQDGHGVVHDSGMHDRVDGNGKQADEMDLEELLR